MRRALPRIFGLMLLLVAACVPQGKTVQMPLGREGKVVVYLQPLPQEAAAIRCEIIEAAVRRQDGTAVPLALAFHEVVGARLIGVQKRLAQGWLPPGTYHGLSLRLGQAFLRGEEGENALLVPKEPVVVAGEFSVREGRAAALFLSMPPADWATQGFRFAPAFVLRRAAPVLPRLLGMATTPETNDLWVFNKKAMQVADVLATGDGPRDVVLDQVRGRAYVALSGEDAVQVFDANTLEPIRKVHVHPGDEPRELAVTPDGAMVITANYGSNTVSLIDSRSLFEIDRVRVGTGPVSVVVDSRGDRAYVLNALANSLSVIQVADRRVVATVALGEAPLRAAMSRDGRRIFVVGDFSPNLLAVDTATLALAERIYVGGRPLCLTVDTRTGLVYVGTLSGEIAIIDPASQTSIDSLQAAGGVAAVTIDRDENALFSVVPERRTIEKLNLVSKRTIAVIELGEQGYDTAVTGER